MDEHVLWATHRTPMCRELWEVWRHWIQGKDEVLGHVVLGRGKIAPRGRAHMGPFFKTPVPYRL